MTTHTQNGARDAATVFAGDGESAARCRAFDWASTPLGPVAEWSPALRTAASLVVAAGLPNVLLWGRGLTQIYNDAYAAIIRAKHPYALGRGNAEVWPEVWHINGPIFERVVAGDLAVRADAEKLRQILTTERASGAGSTFTLTLPRA